MQIDKFEGADFKYDNSFNIPSEKYANQTFSILNLKIFILHQTLQLGKFEGLDFKYDNGFFKFWHIEKFKGTNFKNDNGFFKISAKIPNANFSLKA